MQYFVYNRTDFFENLFGKNQLQKTNISFHSNVIKYLPIKLKIFKLKCVFGNETIPCHAFLSLKYIKLVYSATKVYL